LILKNKSVEIFCIPDEKSGSPACAYSLLDFEDEEEFLAFFIKYRLCIVEVVRQATRELLHFFTQ
jgi:hypothetical protein